MKIRDYNEELSLIRELWTKKDKFGRPIIERGHPSHTMKVNPNIQPASLISLLNFIPMMCDPDEDCMSITTIEFAEYSYVNDKASEYNRFIRQVNTLIDKMAGLAMYNKAKHNGIELIFPDFIYYFGEVSRYKDTDDISKEAKIKYYKDFIATVNECIVKNGIIVDGVNPEINKKGENKIDKGEFVTEDEGIEKGEFIIED